MFVQTFYHPTFTFVEFCLNVWLSSSLNLINSNNINAATLHSVSLRILPLGARHPFGAPLPNSIGFRYSQDSDADDGYLTLRDFNITFCKGLSDKEPLKEFTNLTVSVASFSAPEPRPLDPPRPTCDISCTCGGIFLVKCTRELRPFFFAELADCYCADAVSMCEARLGCDREVSTP